MIVAAAGSAAEFFSTTSRAIPFAHTASPLTFAGAVDTMLPTVAAIRSSVTAPVIAPAASSNATADLSSLQALPAAPLTALLALESSVAAAPAPTLLVPAPAAAAPVDAVPVPAPLNGVAAAPFDPVKLVAATPVVLALLGKLATPNELGGAAPAEIAVPLDTTAALPAKLAAPALPVSPKIAALPTAVSDVRAAKPGKASEAETTDNEPSVVASQPPAVILLSVPLVVAAPVALATAATGGAKAVPTSVTAFDGEQTESAETGTVKIEAAPKTAAPAEASQANPASEFSAVLRDLPGQPATPPVTLAAHRPSKAVATAAVTPAEVPVPVVSALPGQIGQQMGIAIARRISTSGDELLVRLDPPELGRIEVRIAFDDRGSLRATIAADSPIALDMLRRDTVDLGRALSEAGVRADAESFRFDSRNGDGRQSRERQQYSGAEASNIPQNDVEEPAYQPYSWQRRVDLLA